MDGGMSTANKIQLDVIRDDSTIWPLGSTFSIAMPRGAGGHRDNKGRMMDAGATLLMVDRSNHGLSVWTSWFG